MPDDELALGDIPVFVRRALGAAALFPEFIGAALDLTMNQVRSLGVVFKMH